MPVAPNNDTTNGYQNEVNNTVENNTETDKSPTFANERGVKDTENGKSDSSSIEEDANSSDSGYKPKTPSTAERRKVFETKVKDESPENEDAGNFERGVNRNSIAERRRLYESRSVSVTDGNLAEKAMGSPTMLRRRDSFKTKSEVIKEDEAKKAVPMLRQQSMDPRLEKVEPVATPASKRTSTVFGKRIVIYILKIILYIFLQIVIISMIII